MKTCIMLTSLLILASCGGSNSSGNGSNGGSSSVISGKFIDAPVFGLEYSSDSYSGTTDAQGSYSCQPGETVTFLINGFEVGSASCAKLLTPVEVTDSTDYSDQKANNLALLLQSIDSDGDPNNGITLGADKSNITAPIDLTDDTAIDNVVAVMPNNTLTRQQALDHVRSFAGNIGTWELAVTCVGSATNPVFSGTCLPFTERISFDGYNFTSKIDGYEKDYLSPTVNSTGGVLNFGGVVNEGTRNASTGETEMTSGQGLYFRDVEETESSTCNFLGYDYVMHAIRVTDVTLDEDNNSRTGKIAYTVICRDEIGDNREYDEFWGTIALSKVD